MRAEGGGAEGGGEEEGRLAHSPSDMDPVREFRVLPASLASPASPALGFFL